MWWKFVVIKYYKIIFLIYSFIDDGTYIINDKREDMREQKVILIDISSSQFLQLRSTEIPSWVLSLFLWVSLFRTQLQDACRANTFVKNKTLRKVQRFNYSFERIERYFDREKSREFPQCFNSELKSWLRVCRFWYDLKNSFLKVIWNVLKLEYTTSYEKVSKVTPWVFLLRIYWWDANTVILSKTLLELTTVGGDKVNIEFNSVWYSTETFKMRNGRKDDPKTLKNLVTSTDKTRFSLKI